MTLRGTLESFFHLTILETVSCLPARKIRRMGFPSPFHLLLPLPSHSLASDIIFKLARLTNVIFYSAWHASSLSMKLHTWAIG